MLSETIMKKLRPLTEEEEIILHGTHEIDFDHYRGEKASDNVVRSKELLANSKQIDVNIHPRFAYFPKHTHDYVEIVYMCSGSLVNYVNGERILLEEGDLLLLGKGAIHEAEAAGEDDIAVNIIIVPEFLGDTLDLVGTDDTPLREFLVGFLSDEENTTPYLYFAVADVEPVQNCVENLVFSLMSDTSNKRKINRTTLALLFMNLMNCTDRLQYQSKENTIIMYTLRYIENHFVDGSLSELAELLQYDQSWLSREIKKYSGKNFVELLQQRRLTEAVFYLENTDKKIDDIAVSVGYENLSYFYKLFRTTYGVSPRTFRKQHEKVRQS